MRAGLVTVDAIEVRWNIHFITVLARLFISALAMIGSAPLKYGVPPWPYIADILRTGFIGV